MLKRLLPILLLLAWPALAQVPPPAGIVINQTGVQGGTTTQCLYITSQRKVGSQVCGTGTAADIKVGTTTISSGTTTRILYDNAGVLGEYTISGSGTVVAMATSPVFTTPTLGVAAGTSLALGGATIGSNALAVTGSTSLGGSLTFTPDNTYDIGANAATRPANLYVSNTINGAGDIRSGSNFKGTGANAYLSLNTAQGVAVLTTAGGTSGSGVRLNFNTDGILKVLARDGLSDAAITASSLTTTGGGAFTITQANVVSPTAPNRTITISVGGTTYYLAAKTTND